MNTFGILILSTIFLVAGGMLGALLSEVFTGHLAEAASDRALFMFTLIANPLCWFCIWSLWRKARRQLAISPSDSRLRVPSLLVRGLPVTDRIAFLAFTTLWMIGFLFAVVASLLDPTYRR